ncbi:MAG: 30S ribosomal protein S12 methylthiotransferase RimO [Defluviitaleaceae bacterium]|nr:30S ribosomal protein S12 methylthiotransferase RimO [Defluviitaleaceae bacterium]
MSKIYLVSLGCDKNRVDGEVMVGTLRLAGYEVVNNPEVAEAIIINTCGFISDAVQESVDMVFELAEYKKSGNCRALVIVGCMAERYKNEITKTIPEADAIIGVGQYEKIAEVINSVLVQSFEPLENTGLARLSARHDAEASHIAYIKISEGCDNHCTYCTIPQIRGAYKSRPMEEILEESRLLVEVGAKELVIVAQDTAQYGADIYGTKKLPELLKKIAETSGALWIRLMYAYPEHITPALIDVMAETPQICKYIDMPIQHSEDKILTAMGRKNGKRELEQLIGVLRERIPEIAIRTTLMVGFPSETSEDFQNMYNFAKSQKFDRMGAFPYSREEGTKAAEMPRQVKPETKQKRLAKIMELQQKIHFAAQQEKVGQTLQIMVDTSEGNTYTGRTQHDAYEVDAIVTFTSETPLKPGEIHAVKITAAYDYDLQGVAT